MIKMCNQIFVSALIQFFQSFCVCKFDSQLYNNWPSPFSVWMVFFQCVSLFRCALCTVRWRMIANLLKIRNWRGVVGWLESIKRRSRNFWRKICIEGVLNINDAVAAKELKMESFFVILQRLWRQSDFLLKVSYEFPSK